MVMHFNLSELSGSNDQEKFAIAANLLRANPGSELLVPPGQYYLGNDDTIQFQKDVMAGRMGHTPSLFKHGVPLFSAINLINCAGNRIHACGAELILRGFMRTLFLDKCTNMVVEGFRIRHERLPFSCGIIISDTPEYTDIKFRDARMLCDETPTLRIVTYWKNRYYLSIQSAECFRMLEPGIGRFVKLDSTGMRGAEIYVWHTYHYSSAVLLHECENVLLQDLCVHNQPGHGVNVHRSKNITLNRVRIIPEPGLRVSTNADATHVFSCHGKITFHGCRMMGQGDDAINVHGYYQRVLSFEGNSVIVRLDTRMGCAHSFMPDHPDPGDTVVLARRDNFKTFGQAKVRSVTMAAEYAWKLELDTTVQLPKDCETVLYSVEQCTPQLEISNCCMAAHLARGILIKAKNVRIENNVFYNTALTAIQFAPEVFYAEGIESENVMIRNNCIYDCGLVTQYTGKEFSGTGGILFEVCSEKPAEIFHKNIKIENNMIHCPDAKHAIRLYNTKGAQICDNQLCVQAEAIVIDESSCEGIVIDGNEESKRME